MLSLICENLGVEVNEIWMANNGLHYSINEHGELIHHVSYSFGGTDEIQSDIERLIIGEIKPKFVPGDYVYVPHFSYNLKTVKFKYNTDDKLTKHYFDLGIACKTEEEAINLREKMLTSVKYMRG